MNKDNGMRKKIITASFGCSVKATIRAETKVEKDNNVYAIYLQYRPQRFDLFRYAFLDHIDAIRDVIGNLTPNNIVKIRNVLS